MLACAYITQLTHGMHIMENTYNDNNEAVELQEEQEDNKLVFVSTEQYNKAKEDRDSLKKELQSLELAKSSKLKFNIWSFDVLDKQNCVIWTPWSMLKYNGDFVDYGSWRFILRAISEKDKEAFRSAHGNASYSSYNRYGKPPKYEFDENNGLYLLLTKNNNDPVWIDNVTSGTTGIMELPMSHYNAWRYSESAGSNYRDFFTVLKKANFAPALEYERDVFATHKANNWGTPNGVAYHQFMYGLTGYSAYSDQDKNLAANYFSDFHSEVEKAVVAYKKKRNAVLSKISKLNNVIQAYESGTALNKLTESKKAAREEKIQENKGRKLGKEFEQFARLAVELSRIKETIAELENEIAADDCQLEHAYFNNRMEKVMVGFNALRGFIKKSKKEAAE